MYGNLSTVSFAVHFGVHGSRTCVCFAGTCRTVSTMLIRSTRTSCPCHPYSAAASLGSHGDAANKGDPPKPPRWQHILHDISEGKTRGSRAASTRSVVRVRVYHACAHHGMQETTFHLVRSFLWKGNKKCSWDLETSHV